MRFLILFIALFVSLNAKKPTICLNMIVKNESSAIIDCLESVKKHIDYWVIVDTGSTDGTQEIVKRTMKGIPGELHEREWVNFATNRNQALDLARNKADYLLMIDADERFANDTGGKLPNLDADCYFIKVRETGADYLRIFLIHTTCAWKWKGVLHESLMCDEGYTFDLIEGAVLLSNTELGYRSRDEKKYLKDALVLEDALRENPTNSRYVFYLAQSYYNANEFQKAKIQYQRRTLMGGFDQEIFWSLFRIALIQQLEGNLYEANQGFIKAHQYRRSRAEPLFHLAENYIAAGEFLAAYTVARYALTIPMPTDNVFVERWKYIYGFTLKLAHAAYELKFYDEAQHLWNQVLQIPDLDTTVRQSVEWNLSLIP